MSKFLKIFFFSFLLTNSFAQVSPFTNDTLVCKDSINELRFLVSGHFHGSSSNTSGLPALTLRSNIDKINNSGSEFIVSLGDLFLDVRNDIPAYKKHLFDSLDLPLYNVVGNHDLSGSVYQENFGNTWFAFKCFNSEFIFLDSEINDGSISGEQLSFLQNELNNTQHQKNVFVFMHRLLWAEEHPEMKNLFKDNTRGGKNNFRDEIFPMFQKESATKNIFFFGGSLGNSPSCFFFHKEPNINISYIATAIRDLPKDAMLEVVVKNDNVEFNAFPLPLDPQYYNLDYFKPTEHKPSPFNWRLVPLYVKNTLSSRFFWYGAIVSLSLMMVGIMLNRKFRKRK